MRGWALAAALSWVLAGAHVQAQEQRVSGDARELATWVVRSGDAAGRPYAIVDKKSARIHLFDARHQLVASSDVLLGQTVGDHTVEGVGQRTQEGRVGLHERTTPAGRFEIRPGRNDKGEHVLWLDYEAAFAIHRLRPGARLDQRLARLASPSPRDNRDTLGCVVVPVAFYLDQVQPLLSRRSVVYVLPEAGISQWAALDL
ncbi:L,D-transpeptidase [Ramlibacter sp. AW1]|uniref:L,D-transpeptidase n=1 Tax=Ramlibacter aurantiacus TaxID=2801330 RepID=A0A936ZE44_9BURK|nr:L,D-transpeptidase [Ramlibacter aurantiacus]MBL0419889.1 L,D-transpeptidase [Ramlibacter aurantiacus]